MKKTVKLPHDGFQKALKINALLAEGWSISQDPDDEDVIIVEKTNVNESTSGPQALLD
jgi:hypothetical protein